MNTYPQTPTGYDGHLERAKIGGFRPMTPERWEAVCKEMDEMPGTLDLPEPK